MKFLAYVHEHFEDVFVREILKLADIKDVKVMPNLVEFELTDKIQEKISKIILYSRSLRRIMILFDSYEFKDFDDILDYYKKYFQDISITENINHLLDDMSAKSELKTFCSRTLKKGSYEFNSQNLDALIGEIILENNKDLKVNLETPDFIIFNLIINDKIYFGMDLTNLDLGKRDYKVYSVSGSMKSSLIFSLFYHYLDDEFFKNIKEELIVNYNVIDGSFLIEFAQYLRNISPLTHNYKDLIINNYFDISKYFTKTKEFIFKLFGLDKNFAALNAVKKNMALADIKDDIKLSRLDISWLDTKYEEHTIDLLFTSFVPRAIMSDKDIQKHCEDFVYQLDFVLRHRAIIVTTKPQAFIQAYEKKKPKLKLYEQLNFNVGTNNYSVIVFDKA